MNSNCPLATGSFGAAILASAASLRSAQAELAPSFQFVNSRHLGSAREGASMACALRRLAALAKNHRPLVASGLLLMLFLAMSPLLAAAELGIPSIKAQAGTKFLVPITLSGGQNIAGLHDIEHQPEFCNCGRCGIYSGRQRYEFCIRRPGALG